MNEIKLQDIVGGELQEKFQTAFNKVVKNMQDPNTSYRVKRGITIKLTFVQPESRDRMICGIDVVEKLAPQAPMTTNFAIGEDLRTGKLYAQEYGKQIKGQMSIKDFEESEKERKVEEVGSKEVDTETGEIISGSVVDFRKAAL